MCAYFYTKQMSLFIGHLLICISCLLSFIFNIYMGSISSTSSATDLDSNSLKYILCYYISISFLFHSFILLWTVHLWIHFNFDLILTLNKTWNIIKFLFIIAIFIFVVSFVVHVIYHMEDEFTLRTCMHLYFYFVHFVFSIFFLSFFFVHFCVFLSFFVCLCFPFFCILFFVF